MRAFRCSTGELVQASGAWVNDRTHGLPDGDRLARAARDYARELLEEAREQIAKQVEKIDLDDGGETAKAMLAEDRERAWGDALLLFLEGRLRS